jgi:hypothetical protein
VETAINVGEPLFKLNWTTVIFCRVLLAAKKRFDFEMRGLKLEGAWLSFYIKPADGYKLPKIMQWLKQTFSVWFNITTWRLGHVWGNRYWSEILPGEPSPEAVPVDWDRRQCFFPAWRISCRRAVAPVLSNALNVLGATGRDTCIQHGTFIAPAPWRGVQATPPAQLVVPVSGAAMGGVRSEKPPRPRKKRPGSRAFAIPPEAVCEKPAGLLWGG